MLLSINNPYPSQPPKTLTNHTLTFFPIPKTITPLQNLKPRQPKILIRANSKPDSETLPHSAIQRIADKLRSLGFADPNQIPDPLTLKSIPKREARTIGEVFIPLRENLPKHRVGHTLDPSWSTPENPVPRPGVGVAMAKFYELRIEVKRQKEERKREEKARGRVPSLAELSLSEGELRRLRWLGIAEKRKLKVGKAGVTEGIVNGVHERWRRAEVVKIVCEDLCRMNMKRTHELLERKTGGLVVWRAGSKIALYRGANYKYPYFLLDKSSTNETSSNAVQNTHGDNGGIDKMGSCLGGSDATKSSGPSMTGKMGQPALIHGVGLPNRVRFQLPGEAQLVEEIDCLLDGLGPRFTDWWGYEPLPVDADLLPAVVPGYRKPFRLLPYGVKPILTNDEMTTLKRLGRPLPCHFALGRNRRLQGLAASIVKLWEKCEIAKIAVKRGVQNTNSELMAEELKQLTGGTLLSRDREFIVFYRGKDFLPSAVSSALEERRKRGIDGYKQRLEHSTSAQTGEDLKDGGINPGSIEEIAGTNDQRCELRQERKLRSTEEAISRTSSKLSLALEKKAETEKRLAELEKEQMPVQSETDNEGITEEERYMLRKVGLQMKPFLLMGRRGIFDGTIENMHLHWKYRELVKIICKEKSFASVNQVAQTLEAQSGGILVAVEKVKKGFVIIVYRGKNYERPASLRPSTLLNKKQAMKRSLEAQRHESMKLNVLKLTRSIDLLKHKLEKHNVQLFDESRFQEREEVDILESASMRSDSEIQSDHSYLVVPAHCEDNVETRNEHGADSNSVDLNDDLDASVNGAQPTQRANQAGLFSIYDGHETCKSEPKSSSESVSKKTCQSLLTHANDAAVVSTFCHENMMSEEASSSPLVHAEHCVSDNEATGLTVKSAENELEALVSVAAEEQAGIPSTVVHLSNRDRLLLRKQALKMKKRPVLAVGSRNIVNGVAKAIKDHFKRHPLAVVNVKSIAKRTSVQEVVFKLEQATGAILVSREPSKVILYRGWGANDEPGHKGIKNARTSVGTECRAQHGVSPELMAAIRLECGLQHNQEEKPTPSAKI